MQLPCGWWLRVLVEGGVLSGEGYESGCYVKPAIAEVSNDMDAIECFL